MGVFAKSEVVLVRFPFSDLTAAKLRPALILAELTNEDYMLCQITSKPYQSTHSVELPLDGYLEEALRHISYARPDKIFTANASLIEKSVGKIKPEIYSRISTEITELIKLDH